MATAAQSESLQGSKPRDLWKIGDALVLLAYSGVVLWTIRYHEKWADEAQAWLIARDLDLKTIWFHELRYEGSPGLWHTILWIAQHVFHLRYGALGYIGAVFAIAGAAVLLFLAPFPRYIRWPLAFTYVMVYQYAVIARPYTLLPLLAFLAALLFKDTHHPERLTVVLALMALLTLHGAILAGCLGLAYLLDALKSWKSFGKPLQRRYFLCIATLALVFIFIAIILKPTPDVEEFAIKNEIARAPAAVRANFPSFEQKLVAVFSGAFIDYFIASIGLAALLGVWCIWRRKGLPFVLPVGMLLAFYVSVHGAAHHHGTVFVAAVVGLWIAWPGPEEKWTFGRMDEFALAAVKVMLLILCAVNIWDAGAVIKHEYFYPYSGATDAAVYLKSVGADGKVVFGFLHGVTAIQAYFDRNIFANTGTAYYHHGLPLNNTLNLEELYRLQPEYVVSYSDVPEVLIQQGAPALFANGYVLVHFSDGYYLYKRGVYERETYFIFRKSRITKPEAAIEDPKAGMTP